MKGRMILSLYVNRMCVGSGKEKRAVRCWGYGRDMVKVERRNAGNAECSDHFLNGETVEHNNS